MKEADYIEDLALDCNLVEHGDDKKLKEIKGFSEKLIDDVLLEFRSHLPLTFTSNEWFGAVNDTKKAFLKKTEKNVKLPCGHDVVSLNDASVVYIPTAESDYRSITPSFYCADCMIDHAGLYFEDSQVAEEWIFKVE